TARIETSGNGGWRSSSPFYAAHRAAERQVCRQAAPPEGGMANFQIPMAKEITMPEGPNRAVLNIDSLEFLSPFEFRHSTFARRPTSTLGLSDQSLRHQHKHILQRRVFVGETAHSHFFASELIEQVGDLLVVGLQLNCHAVVFDLDAAR